MKKYWVFRIIKGVLFAAVAIFVFGYVVMYLWDWLVPTLFHGPPVTFGEAIGLLILSKLLFGGFRKGGCGHGGWHHRKHYWKEKMEARMANMTPEEKEKFREQMKVRCGGKWGTFDWEVEKGSTEK